MIRVFGFDNSGEACAHKDSHPRKGGALCHQAVPELDYEVTRVKGDLRIL